MNWYFDIETFAPAVVPSGSSLASPCSQQQKTHVLNCYWPQVQQTPPWQGKYVTWNKYPKNIRSSFSIPDNTRLGLYMMQIPVPDPYPNRPEIFFPIPDPYPTRSWKTLPVSPCFLASWEIITHAIHHACMQISLSKHCQRHNEPRALSLELEWSFDWMEFVSKAAWKFSKKSSIFEKTAFSNSSSIQTQ